MVIFWSVKIQEYQIKKMKKMVLKVKMFIGHQSRILKPNIYQQVQIILIIQMILKSMLKMKLLYLHLRVIIIMDTSEECSHILLIFIFFLHFIIEHSSRNSL